MLWANPTSIFNKLLNVFWIYFDFIWQILFKICTLLDFKLEVFGYPTKLFRNILSLKNCFLHFMNLTYNDFYLIIYLSENKIAWSKIFLEAFASLIICFLKITLWKLKCLIVILLSLRTVKKYKNNVGKSFNISL